MFKTREEPAALERVDNWNPGARSRHPRFVTADAENALELGTRVASILATGRRESTYKLVTLLALIHYATDWCPDVNDALEVDLIELAQRVSTLYRPSLESYQDRSPLLQVKRDFKITMLKEIARVEGDGQPASNPNSLRGLAQHIAQQPLTHLQHEGGQQSPDFLFDSSWLHKKITREQLDDHGWRIHLLPGVAHKLAKLAPLLIPVIERLWVTEVLRFNPSVAEARVEEYLFGAARRAVTRLAPFLLEAQSGRCFHCAQALKTGQIQVDHVLPWSRCGFDGLSNLVVADTACNLSRSDSLPDPAFVRDAARRPYLEGVCDATNWMQGIEAERMRRTAMGQFRFLPNYYRLWRSRSESMLVTTENRTAILTLIE